MKTHTQKNKRGFTLIELLVVISIILVLAALGFATVTTAMKRSKTVASKKIATDIRAGVEAYYNDYSSMPSTNSLTSDTEIELGENSQNGADLLKILSGKEEASSGIAPKNQKAINYIESITEAKAKARGIIYQGRIPVACMDAFGKPFTVVLDGDYNQEIDIPARYKRNIDPQFVRGYSIVTSPGADKNNGSDKANKDNVNSWD